MANHDQLHRFLFEHLDLRGELVQMETSWQTVLKQHDYPEAVRTVLGQTMAATLIMSATIKFDGSLIIQAQSSGPITTLVSQATSERTVRGLAHWEGEVADTNLAATFGDGQLVITVDGSKTERYQGIVALEGANIAEALQNYFSASEQLESRFWLFANGERAAGLFLQQLPSEQEQNDDWERITALADTITEDELLNLSTSELLHRLFHEEEVRLFEAEPVSFRCSCSRKKIESSLLAMGKQEADDIIKEQGGIHVDCDFCNQHYQFDKFDTEQLFSSATLMESPQRVQ